MPSEAPDSFVVRSATIGDLEGMLRCLAEAFEPYRDAYTAEAFLHTVLNPELARERLASMRVLVAVAGSGRILGTLSWIRTSPESGHLRGMAVVPERQGGGVAQALLDRVLADLREEGCRRVTLRTPDPLVRAVRFYERNRFRASGRTADFHGMTVRERGRELDA